MAAPLSGLPFAVNITGLGTAFQKEGLLKTLVKDLYHVGLGRAGTVFIYRKSRDKKEEMGRASHAVVGTEFDKKQVVEETLFRLYRKI